MTTFLFLTLPSFLSPSTLFFIFYILIIMLRHMIIPDATFLHPSPSPSTLIMSLHPCSIFPSLIISLDTLSFHHLVLSFIFHSFTLLTLYVASRPLLPPFPSIFPPLHLLPSAMSFPSSFSAFFLLYLPPFLGNDSPSSFYPSFVPSLMRKCK